MANVVDFPITELFGCQPGYPLNTNVCPPGQGFHNGVDYGCPVGTPVVVNGVTVGLSGATGYITGPHCHVGRWVNGSATDPGVGNGFTFNSAIVSEINQDSTNGKYVRIQADGASWVYLHLSEQLVSAGQELKGGYMGFDYNSIPTSADKTTYFEGMLGRAPTEAELANPQPWGEINGVVANELKAKASALTQQVNNPPGFKAYNGAALFVKE